LFFRQMGPSKSERLPLVLAGNQHFAPCLPLVCLNQWPQVIRGSLYGGLKATRQKGDKQAVDE